MLRALAALTISACFLGCGGNVVVDHGSAGGHGAGGSGIGGFGGATEGPASGSISSTGSSVESVTSSSSDASSTGAAMSCPSQVYEDAACQVEGQSCPTVRSCCGGGAVCKNGAWHFTGAPCNMPCIPCGPDDGFGCQLGSLCVVEQLDVGTSYHCAEDPCQPGGDSCICAGPVCDGLTCESVAGQNTVFCDCPNC